MEIQESEKRRARNLIWNAAGEYGYEPDFKAYDAAGQADLYWNSIIGAARKAYGADTLEALFRAIRGSARESLYEQLLWLGLENAVYQREAAGRPALPSLRRIYARQVLANNLGAATQLDVLEDAHFRRVLGLPEELTPWDRKLLDALEFPADWDGQTLMKNALELLHTWFGFVPGQEPAAKKPRRRFLLFGRRGDLAALPAVRSFGRGFGEHLSQGGGENAQPIARRLTDKNAAQTEEALRKYITACFGASLYSPEDTAQRERELCADSHKGCHLYYAAASTEFDPRLRGYTAAQRRAALKQMDANRAAYASDSLRHRNSILRLTARIRNAMMAYLQPEVVRTSYGALDGSRVWRGVYLDDDKVFTHIQQSDPGQLCVDILLDASTSQLRRQEIVAAQGYMIAESLNRCGIPVRVSSYCSLSGYTILTRYRNYNEVDKNDNIFNYFTTGCNRDGLAIRAICREMEEAPCEHRMLILLSDAKPNDVIQMEQSGRYVDYAGDNSVQNTAAEVRTLTRQDISVICVFTGEDDDIPAAHTIYGRNFARIRSLDQFADTVGTLIQNQIRSL